MALDAIKYVGFCLSLLVVVSSPLVVAEELRQVCKESQRATTPSDDFQFNGDGTATHRKTGLTWMRCSVGQVWDEKQNTCVDDGITDNDEYDWNSAMALAADFEFASKKGWRLPNVKELASIVELKCFRPSINLDVFPGSYINGVWLAMPDEKQKYSGWLVYLGYGNSRVDLKKVHGWLRLVRS